MGSRSRAFFRSVVEWHRYLAAAGSSRPVGRAITGASNLAFLFIVVSGIFLWFPRVWRWSAVRGVVWFKGGLRGKARDFNWHNTIGFWSAVPLADRRRRRRRHLVSLGDRPRVPCVR